MPPARSKWIALCGAVVLIAAVVASLIPANMQIRTGLHWQVEHFLARNGHLLLGLAAAVHSCGCDDSRLGPARGPARADP